MFRVRKSGSRIKRLSGGSGLSGVHLAASGKLCEMFLEPCSLHVLICLCQKAESFWLFSCRHLLWPVLCVLKRNFAFTC